MTERFEHGYALLVGVNENQVADWALPDVAKDLTALQEVLAHPERCAYPPEQVKTISGADATRSGILAGLEWLQEQITADGSDNATAVLYYTGHGFRAGEDYYLIPYDVREGRIPSYGLRAEDLAREVELLKPQRLLVILDCCHAGGMGVKGVEDYVGAAMDPARLMPQGKGVGRAKGLDDLAQGHGRAVLSSSTGEQRSYMRLDGKMSIFTYHLIEALTGHAQPEGGATEVLVSDVMGYVTRQVPASVRSRGVQQTPDFRVSGNFPVALLLGGKGLSKGRLAPDPLASLPETTERTSYHTELHGSGASAQGRGAVAAGERGVAVGGNVQGGLFVTGDGNVVGDGSSRHEQKGGIRAGRIEAENVVDGVQVQGGTPAGAGDLVELARSIQSGGITAGEIKAGSVVSGLQFLTGRPPETRSELRQEVAALRRQVEQAVAAGEFASRGDAEDVTGALQAAEAELDRPEPDGRRVARKLRSAAEVLTGAAEAATAARKVGVEIIRLAPVAAALYQLAQAIL